MAVGDNKNKQGKFVVIEGLDGSGKSTQLKLLSGELTKLNQPCLITREPTGARVGKLIRRVLGGELELPLDALQLLFVADRRDHLAKTIEPALAAGKIVVCDRYFWSTIAYGTLEFDKEWLLSLHRYCRRPDLTIFINVSPVECLRRIQSRGEVKSIFEKRQELGKIQRSYEWLTKKFADSTIIVDGERKPEQISQEIWQNLF